MEDNNRGTEQKIDIEAVLNENKEIKEAYNNLAARARELNNTWMITRANMLLEVIKIEAFPDDVKQKAIKELSEFLYPVREESETKEDKE